MGLADMSDEPETTPISGATATTEKLEVAHILFMDIVGYAKLPMEQQARVVNELQALVHDTADYRESNPRGDLLCLPRGDGMALVFFRDALAPVRCACEIARELKSRPHIRLRMGVNTGPVYLVEDINEDPDVSGIGIVNAQRVMDYGDEGHILVSGTVAEHITTLAAWAPYVHDMGMCEVKHGQRVHLFNFYTREIGNAEHPRKVMAGYAAVVERMRAPHPKPQLSRFYAVRDSLMIVFWVCFVGGGIGWGLWTISPTFKSGLSWLLPRSEEIPAKSRTEPGPQSSANPSGSFDPSRVTGMGSAERSRSRGSGNEAKAPGYHPPQDPPVEVRTTEQFIPPTIELVAGSTGKPMHGTDNPDTPDDDAGNHGQTDAHAVDITVRTGRDGLQSRDIKVEYDDDRGPGDLVVQQQAKEDEPISRPIEVYGKRITIHVYYNDKQVLTRTYRVPDR